MEGKILLPAPQRSQIEILFAENCFLRKEDQDAALKIDCKGAFELD